MNSPTIRARYSDGKPVGEIKNHAGEESGFGGPQQKPHERDKKKKIKKKKKNQNEKKKKNRASVDR